MLRYAYRHGALTIALENSEIICGLRFFWIKNGKRLHENYNWKVNILRSRIIGKIAMKTPIYGLHVKYVNPKGAIHSKEHDETTKRHGLDGHTAGAYLIALKSIKVS